MPTVLAAGVAMLITRLRGNGPRVDLGLVWSWHDVRVGLAYGIGGLVVTIPASLLYVVLVGPEQASSAVGDVFEGLRAGPVAALGVALVVVGLAPLCEEIVYRGLLWGALERYALPRWVPFVVTTLLFALAHFEFTRTPLLFVVALPIALARMRTGRLAASVVAHQVNNLLPGVVLALAIVGVLPTTWASPPVGHAGWCSWRGTVWHNGGSAPRLALYRAAATQTSRTTRLVTPRELCSLSTTDYEHHPSEEHRTAWPSRSS